MGSNHAFSPFLLQSGHICHTDRLGHGCNLDEVSEYTLSVHHGQQARQGSSNASESGAIQSSSSLLFFESISHTLALFVGVC